MTKNIGWFVDRAITCRHRLGSKMLIWDYEYPRYFLNLTSCFRLLVTGAWCLVSEIFNLVKIEWVTDLFKSERFSDFSFYPETERALIWKNVLYQKAICILCKVGSLVSVLAMCFQLKTLCIRISKVQRLISLSPPHHKEYIPPKFMNSNMMAPTDIRLRLTLYMVNSRMIDRAYLFTHSYFHM